MKEKSGECTVRAMALKRYDFPAINQRRTEAELTPEWERAEKLTAEECAELRRKREFNDQKLRALYAKRTDYESKRSAGRARAVPPAQIAERIEAMRTELSDMTLRCDAVRLAIDTLESAGEKLRADVMPRIIKGASERFSTATLGRYSSLGVAHDFSMSYTGRRGYARGGIPFCGKRGQRVYKSAAFRLPRCFSESGPRRRCSTKASRVPTAHGSPKYLPCRACRTVSRFCSPAASLRRSLRPRRT